MLKLYLKFSKKVKGKNCDRQMTSDDSICASNPCWNAGACTPNEENTAYTCACLPGTSGKHCNLISPSFCGLQNPCQNNATCELIKKNGIMQATCQCNGYWTGQYCETELMECDQSKPCHNGGFCFEKVCKCPRDFRGHFCEVYGNWFFFTFLHIVRLNCSSLVFQINFQIKLKEPPKIAVLKSGSLVENVKEKSIKIINRGFLFATATIIYDRKVNDNRVSYEQKRTLGFLSETLFTIQPSEIINDQGGAALNVNVVFGPSFTAKVSNVDTQTECYRLSGIFFAASWDKVECWFIQWWYLAYVIFIII